ncbi:MAG: hypothetical protein O6951_05080, partial [Actinobacteria bacterium]|nr:hypothetical protein [Actinomycetota bacterium]
NRLISYQTFAVTFESDQQAPSSSPHATPMGISNAVPPDGAAHKCRYVRPIARLSDTKVAFRHSSLPRWFDFALWVSGLVLGALASFFIARHFYSRSASAPADDDGEDD